MKRLLSDLLAIGVFVGGIEQAKAQPSYNYTTLAVPGGTETLPFGISGSGQIVGRYFDSRGVQQPFLLSGGSYTTLIPVGATAYGINDAGQIVLSSLGRDFSPGHAYLLSGGILTSLDMPGSTTTSAWGINNLGQIVGSSSLLGAFVLSGGNYTPIAVPGATGTGVWGINNFGQIVGSYAANNVGHGYVLSGGVYTTFDVPGSTLTLAFGINSVGQIVGQYQSPDGRNHGFLLSGDSYTTVDPPGSTFTQLRGINDSGEIVGYYFDGTSGPPQGFLATPTPEPSVLLLLGLGTLVLVGWAWGQKERSNRESSERGLSVNGYLQIAHADLERGGRRRLRQRPWLTSRQDAQELL